jgi:signal transduction histidine kinase
MGLRARLILSAGYLLVAILLALELPLAFSVEHAQTTSFESRELGFAGLLASRLSDPVSRASRLPAEPATADPAIDAAIAAVANEVSKADLPAPRILVVDANYGALADTSSEFAPGTIVSTAGRPELNVAIAQGTIWAHSRFSATLGQDLLIVAVPIFDAGNVVGAVRLSSPLSDVQEAVHASWLGLALVGLAALVIGLALAWLLATSVSGPVRNLEAVAGRLGGGDLEARADDTGPAEVSRLAGSFNRMADTLTANMVAQRDFVANASHQLRTPLTGLRLRLEAIEAEGGPPAEQAAKAEVEVDRMASLVEDLLTLARATEVETTGASIDLTECAREAVERWTDTAGRSGNTVTLAAAGPVRIWAGADDVEHVLDNLIENAIRYCPPGTTVSVETARTAAGGLVGVSDDGPGIAADDRERVFERFYRGANGRSAGPGTGLGLAIVRQLALRWGGNATLGDGSAGAGNATLGDGSAGAGTRVEVTFPAAPTVP